MTLGGGEERGGGGVFFFAAGAGVRFFFLLRVRGCVFFFAAGRGRVFFLLRVRGRVFFFAAGAGATRARSLTHLGGGEEGGRGGGGARFFFCCGCGGAFFFFCCGCGGAFFYLLRVRGRHAPGHSLTGAAPKKAPTAKKHPQQKKKTRVPTLNPTLFVVPRKGVNHHSAYPSPGLGVGWCNAQSGHRRRRRRRPGSRADCLNRRSAVWAFNLGPLLYGQFPKWYAFYTPNRIESP